MEFERPIKVMNIFRRYPGIWMIARGWAIELYLGKETRIHKDIEVAIPRAEQSKLRSHLQNWLLEYVSSGRSFSWSESEFLELPIHEIHGNSVEGQIEILLNEIEDFNWVFRRNTSINYPLGRLRLISKLGAPILCHEVVLLYKCKIDSEKDRFDLLNAIPHLQENRINWLKNGIIETHGVNHEWIQLINVNATSTLCSKA